MGFFSGILHRDRSARNHFDGYVDHHSHILPGVDDGFRTIEDSLKCLRIYEQWGFKELWLTPHIMEDFPNKTDDLKRRFDQLNNAYNGNIKLHLASENMVDTLFVDRFSSKDLLPMGDNLLVETSYFSAPENFHDILDNIMHAGMRPILAHPERYIYMTTSEYDSLLNKGVIFQLNIFSLMGMYGHQAKEKALYLLKRGAYTLSGTDIHNLKQTEALSELSKNGSLCSQIINLTFN